MDTLDAKLNRSFAGKVVRKDLTKQIKEGANVPVYVLEYLLGMYCATDDEATIMSPNFNGRSARTVFNSIRLSFVAPDEGDPRRSIQNNFTLDEMFTKAGGFGKHNF